jgi:hypothetical protein
MTPPITSNPNPGPGPAAVTAPVVVGAKPSSPVNQIDPVACQPTDTDFAALSRRFYGTDKYADALLAYNRDHRIALANGDKLMANPPVLTAGQQVWSPPANVLENVYLAKQRPAPTPGPGPVAPVARIPSPISIGNPSPLPQTQVAGNANPGVVVAQNAPPAPRGPNYVVQNTNGEFILDIAERQLGSRSRWGEIYRLNLNVVPENRIPPGTELKMPPR